MRWNTMRRAALLGVLEVGVLQLGVLQLAGGCAVRPPPPPLGTAVAERRARHHPGHRAGTRPDAAPSGSLGDAIRRDRAACAAGQADTCRRLRAELLGEPR